MFTPQDGDSRSLGECPIAKSQAQGHCLGVSRNGITAWPMWLAKRKSKLLGNLDLTEVWTITPYESSYPFRCFGSWNCKKCCNMKSPNKKRKVFGFGRKNTCFIWVLRRFWPKTCRFYRKKLLDLVSGSPTQAAKAALTGDWAAPVQCLGAVGFNWLLVPLSWWITS